MVALEPPGWNLVPVEPYRGAPGPLKPAPGRPKVGGAGVHPPESGGQLAIKVRGRALTDPAASEESGRVMRDIIP